MLYTRTRSNPNRGRCDNQDTEASRQKGGEGNSQNDEDKNSRASKKIKSVSVSIVSPSICHEVMGPDAMIFVFLFFHLFLLVGG